MRKKLPACIRLIRIYFKTLKHLILFLPQRIKKLKQINISNEIGCLAEFSKGCLGCGCLFAVLWAISAIISWAWHIHWLFGLLMVFFLLGFLE